MLRVFVRVIAAAPLAYLVGGSAIDCGAVVIVGVVGVNNHGRCLYTAFDCYNERLRHRCSIGKMEVSYVWGGGSRSTMVAVASPSLFRSTVIGMLFVLLLCAVFW